MITLAGLALPPDLVWRDEFAPWSVETTARWSLSGALLVESARRLKGRPITLAGGPDSAWCGRQTLEALLSLHAQMTSMTLVYGSRTFTVRFAPEGIEAEPVVAYAQDGEPGDLYAVTLHLMEV